jgi:hypothetical protein
MILGSNDVMTFRETIELLPDACTLQSWPLPWLEMRAVTRLSSKGNTLKALNAMERELESSRTFEQIRKIVKAAEVLQRMERDLTEVKKKAEWVILVGNTRIGEEIKKVPKARGPGGKKGTKAAFTPEGKGSGRAATGIPGTSRSRLQKLAAIERPKLRAMAEEMWESGRYRDHCQWEFLIDLSCFE